MLERLSKCLDRLQYWWEDVEEEGRNQEVDPEGKLLHLFIKRATLLSELESLEYDTLLNLPIEAWLYLIRDGRGRDFLWELEGRYRQEKNKDAQKNLQELIIKIRTFLKSHGYEEEELGSLLPINFLNLKGSFATDMEKSAHLKDRLT